MLGWRVPAESRSCPYLPLAVTRSRTFLMSRSIGYSRVTIKGRVPLLQTSAPLRMSPTRTLKSSRMTDRHSEQRKAREAFRRMIQQIDPEVLDVLRAIRKGNIRVTKPNLHGPWRPRYLSYLKLNRTATD